MGLAARLALIVAMVTVEFWFGAALAHAEDYSYQRTDRGVTAATVSLDAATVRSGHVAVWLGADDGLRSIQAGVEQTAGDLSPVVYLEVIDGTRQFAALRVARYGEAVRVELVHRGAWYVKVNGRTVGHVWLSYSVTRVLTGESLGANAYRFTTNHRKELTP